MKLRSIIFTIGLVTLHLCYSSLWARPTTAYEAEKVVTGWLKADAQPLGMILGRRVMKVETFTDEYGSAVYYIVYLQPCGFVIVSADDLVEPIIGFADDGTFDPSPENPLGALVTSDLSRRVTKVRDTYRLLVIVEKTTVTDTQSKWIHFISLAEAPTGGFGLMGLNCVCDVRVAPLVQSRWNQLDACGEACYNYYTPQWVWDDYLITGHIDWDEGNLQNYPCGCIATAMAQLMLYHKHPSDPGGIGVQVFRIEVDGEPSSAKTRGGDGEGGPYRWDLMVTRPDCNTEQEQRQAIGALCYDAGVAVKMEYKSEGSGALMHDARAALVDTFQYSNAVLGYSSGDDIGPGLSTMINPNLDAKAPVMLAVSDSSDPNGGHAVLCDGYGYESSTLYYHLNMGWGGTDDAWYNLPTVSTRSEFNSVTSCLYNIFISGKGEIISGRVLDANGKPIPNARVYAEPSGRAGLMALTDDKGIYALGRLRSNTTYTVWPEVDGYALPRQLVDTGISSNNTATSGNRWGIDFYTDVVLDYPDPSLLFVDFDAPNDPGPSDAGISDPYEDGSAEHPFDAIQEAIDAALPGNTVVVMPGTYTGDGNRDLDFKGKAITVRSTNPDDPAIIAATVIDCNGTEADPHRGFQFQSFETPLSVLEGLTITGGHYEQGGGIYCGDCANPTITCCTFNGNWGSLGGGMYNENGSPKVTDCKFSGNSADAGGGMYNLSDELACNPVVTNCIFYSNTADKNGGGMYNWGYASPTLTNCVFTGNSVPAGGGGAIRNNEGSSPAVTNCVFIKNSAETFGGGIRSSNSSNVTLTNCTFSANSATSGNALACTPDEGGNQSSSSIQVINCILWDGGDEVYNDDGSTIVIVFSNVQGGWSGESNIDADPCFANMGYWDENGTPKDANDDFWVDGDYHLKSQAGRYDPQRQSWLQDDLTSPCIDAGNPTTPIGLEPSPNGGIINMGAYGGTAEASMSLSTMGNVTDLKNDDTGDIEDLPAFVD